MMWLNRILERLAGHPDEIVLQEVRNGTLHGVSGRELANHVARTRAYLRRLELPQGARVVIIGPNSTQWVALDLAAMAEGFIAVTLYVRQAPAEMAYAIADCGAAAVFIDDLDLAADLPDGLPVHGFADIPSTPPTLNDDIVDVPSDRPVTLIYTSGTSGRSKGVGLGPDNVEHMLGCTTERLDALLTDVSGTQRVFHYLPMSFAGSWIMMLTCLQQPGRQLILSTQRDQLRAEIAAARPHVFLNVPLLLERIRTGIESKVDGNGLSRRLFARGRAAWTRRSTARARAMDGLWWSVARVALFNKIRRRIGADLRGLICGSAPLAADTQDFFHMLGLPVLQVYGLTETTAICTMDRPGHITPGRVGSAIAGIEMKLSDQDEVIVRGPHIFLGYWDPQAQQIAPHSEEWFRTGDLGEIDDSGNWRIIGRLKNLIILNSGHNIVPDPLEDLIQRALPEAEQVLVVGNQRSHLAAIVTGEVDDSAVERMLADINAQLPHYKRIHKWLVHREPFSVDNGLMTANGKLRRDAITRKLAEHIDTLYGPSAQKVGVS